MKGRIVKLMDIKFRKDLRNVVFSDLFYRLFEESDGESIAYSLIEQIAPGFIENYKKDRMLAAEYELLRLCLLEARRGQIGREMFGELINFNIPDYSLLMDKKNIIDEPYQNGGFEKLCNAVFEDYAQTECPTEGERQQSRLIRLLVAEAWPYEDFYRALNKKILDIASRTLSSDKLLKSLCLLSRLESDEELILYFGEKYGTSLSAIDAYSGLLYVSEFLDSSGALASIVRQFDDAELSAARERIAEKVDKKRMEEMRRKEEQIKKDKYRKAECMMEKGNYADALGLFQELEDYRDARERTDEAKCREKEQARISKAKSEALVHIEPLIIEASRESKDFSAPWKIIDVDIERNRVLIIAEECIGVHEWGAGTWSECALRQWLNDEFYGMLPEDVRVWIAATQIEDEDAGSIVEDRVFILNSDEVHRYFPSRGERRCSKVGDTYPVYWWLRNLSTSTNKPGVRVVDKDGDASSYEVRVINRKWGYIGDEWEDPPALPGDSRFVGVRPAIWVQNGLSETAIAQRRSEEMIVTTYTQANELIKRGEYGKANEKLLKLGDFKDSLALVDLCTKGINYTMGMEIMQSATTEKECLAAIPYFEKAGDFLPERRNSFSTIISASVAKDRCASHAKSLAASKKLTKTLTRLAKMVLAKDSKTSKERELENLQKDLRENEKVLSDAGFFNFREKKLLKQKKRELQQKIKNKTVEAIESRDLLNREFELKRNELIKAIAKQVRVGSVLYFGQLKKGADGRADPYECRVLKVQDEQILLMMNIGCVQYHNVKMRIPWSSCTLRNKEIAHILLDHFSIEEKSLIKKVRHDTVVDRLFIPNYEEYNSFGLEQMSSWLRCTTEIDGSTELALKGGTKSSCSCTDKRVTILLFWLDYSL